MADADLPAMYESPIVPVKTRARTPNCDQIGTFMVPAVVLMPLPVHRVGRLTHRSQRFS
jgi:hypothetical protein